jgi:hypothetical protein
LTLATGAGTTIASPDPAAKRTIPQDTNHLGHIAGFHQVSPAHTIGFLSAAPFTPGELVHAGFRLRDKTTIPRSASGRRACVTDSGIDRQSVGERFHQPARIHWCRQ